MKRILTFLKEPAVIVGLFFIFLILMSGGVSASISELGQPVKQGECVDLPQGCSDCSYNNISNVLYPNSTQALGQVAMQKTGTFYNYTFCSTEALGTYTVNGYGDPNGVLDNWNYIFDVTSTGREFSSSQGITSTGILFGAILLSFLFSRFSTSLMEKDETFPIGFIFVFLSLALGIYSLYLSYTFSINIVEDSSLSGLTEVIFITFLWLMIAIIVISMALMLISFIKELGRVLETKKFGEGYDPIQKIYR